MRVKSLGLLAVLCSAAFSSSALADDWIAVSVNGIAMTVKNGHWTHLRPIDAVSDNQQFRTLSSGSVNFQRRGESVGIAGDTLISSAEERGGRYSRVTQWYGRTTVADKAQAEPHFEVAAPYMAAVVKGTVFTVWTRPGVSGVNVEHGCVEEQERRSHIRVDVLFVKFL